MSAVPQQPAANDSDSLETREWLESLDALARNEPAVSSVDLNPLIIVAGRPVAVDALVEVAP